MNLPCFEVTGGPLPMNRPVAADVRKRKSRSKRHRPTSSRRRLRFNGSGREVRRGKILSLLAALVLLTGAFQVFAAESGVPPDPATATEDRWTSFLPLMKEEALARGYDLPLPFGVSLVYNYLARDIEINDIRIGINGNAPVSVSRFLDLGSHSKVNAALVKTDVWLLPFLNPYLLAGYIHNESESRGHVTVPSPPPLPPQEFDVAIPTTLDGFVAGGGMTIAAGYREFFMMMDVNYTQTDMGFDDRFRALVASARAGWNGKFGDQPVRLWVGGAYWDTKNTARSTVDVPGVGQIQFEADQGPRHPWNAVVGGSIPLANHWDCFAEYGFNFDDVQIFAAGLGVRF